MFRGGRRGAASLPCCDWVPGDCLACHSAQPGSPNGWSCDGDFSRIRASYLFSLSKGTFRTPALSWGMVRRRTVARTPAVDGSCGFMSLSFLLHPMLSLSAFLSIALKRREYGVWTSQCPRQLGHDHPHHHPQHFVFSCQSRAGLLFPALSLSPSQTPGPIVQRMTWGVCIQNSVLSGETPLST